MRRDSRCLLFVVPGLEVGGTERHLLGLCPVLREAGYRPIVLSCTTVGPIGAQLREAGIEVLAPPRLASVPVLSALGLIWWTLWRLPIGIVHFFLPKAYILGGIVSLGFPNVRKVMSRRSLNHYQRGHPQLVRVERWLHGKMDAMSGNSSAVIEELLEEGAQPSRLHLIQNGLVRFEMAQPSPNVLPRDAKAAFTVVTVANLLPYKGYETAVRALASVAHKLPDGWRYVVIGRDEGYGATLRALSRELGIDRHITFTGEVRTPAAQLAEAELFLFCSHQEGFPNAVLEAMSTNCPVIASDVGGLRDLIPDARVGRLVPAGDVSGFAAAIESMVMDPQMRASVGEAAGRWVREEFTMSRCVERYVSMYQSLAA